MSRVSNIKVDPYLEKEIKNQFWNFLGSLNDTVSREFFSNFLYESENIMLSKRFAILLLLSRGKTPTEIQSSIHVTFSTIGMVSAWLKNSNPQTQKLLEKISKQKSWEEIIDKIDNILNIIPPRRHSNWKEEYSNRYKESRKRGARKSLR